MLYQMLLGLLVFPVCLVAVPSDDVYLSRVQENIEMYDQGEISQPVLSLAYEVFQREKEFEKTHYQLLTAQASGFLVYQLVLKELYRFLCNDEFVEFEFLRPYSSPNFFRKKEGLFHKYPYLFLKNKNVSPFKFIMKGEFVDDHEPSISSSLISCGFSLEMCNEGESPLFFFLHYGEDSYSEDAYPLLMSLFKELGFDVKKTKKVLEACFRDLPHSKTGIITQVFIKKEGIDQILYLSSPYGYIEHLGSVSERIENYLQNRESSAFDFAQNFQARLLAGALTPGEVKIFRYTTIAPDVERKYVNRVRSYFQALFTEHPHLQGSWENAHDMHSLQRVYGK